MTAVHLDASDALEHAEPLQTLSDWLESGCGSLTACLARFTSSPADGPNSLRDDFARFRFG